MDGTTVSDPGSRPPGARTAATRRRLLDAALEVFARKGVHDARVDDICTQAGVARATFYRHFDSKAETVLVLHTQMVEELLRTADELGPLTADPAGFAQLRRLVSDLLTISERWAPLIATLSGGSDVAPGLRERSFELTARFSSGVGRHIAEGGAPDIHPAMAALGMVALIDGVGHQIRTWSLEVDRDEVVDHLATAALAMLHPGADLQAAVAMAAPT